MKPSVYLSLFLFFFPIEETLGHARLLEPPSRASMWRVGYNNPKDENDNQAYCGGFGIQHHLNEGKCGICGDPWHIFPREHEAPGGIYANGIITKSYSQGSLIPVIVDVTANHQGHFEFKICPNNNLFRDPDQSCFDSHPMHTGQGGYKYYIRDYVTGLRILYIRLPSYITCQQCVLQWTYVAGNNWGTCENGTSVMGCGAQEHFRSCADIEIRPHPFLNNDVEYDSDYLADDEETLRKRVIVLKDVLKKIREIVTRSQQEVMKPKITPTSSTILEDEDYKSLRPRTNRHKK